MAGDVLLDARSVTKRFGGFTAQDAVSLDVRAGERFGIIGPNGSGKTTMINCISGTLAIRSMELMAEKVMPEINASIGCPGAADQGSAGADSGGDARERSSRP